MTLRIAAAQYPIDRLGSWKEYREKLSGWVAEAAGAGARLAVFPEYGAMELTSLFGPEIAGDLARQLPALQELLPDFLALHADLARRHGLHILAASLPVRTEDGRFVNRAHFFAPNGSFGHQDKLIMTRFENEEWNVSPSSGIRVFDTALGRIGISICYDVEFPLIARCQAEAGAELILAPSCTDARSGWYRVRVGARARALENQCYVIQSPTVGEAPWSPAVDVNVGAAAVYCPPDRSFFPENGIIAQGELNHPQWVYADLDCGLLRDVRTDGKVLNLRDWPHQQERTRTPVERVAL